GVPENPAHQLRRQARTGSLGPRERAGPYAVCLQAASEPRVETADQAQRPDGAVLVAELLELGMRLLRGGEGVPHHRSLVGLDRRLQLAQLETGQERFVAAGARNGLGLRSELGGLRSEERRVGKGGG